MNYTFGQGLPILMNTPTAIRSLAEELGDNVTHASEGPDTWSFYEILGHLIHCEESDWMPRLQIILSKTGSKKFSPFDRLGFVEKCKGISLEDLLIRFTSRRAHNLNRLRKIQLTQTALESTGIHPKFGPVTASQLLCAWVAHDLNHLSQMSRVLAHQWKDSVGPWKEFMPILEER
jgi:hypothetical protein